MACKNYVHKIAAFREIMLERLRANRYKGGWKDCSPAYLEGRLLEEVVELSHIVRHLSEHGADKLARECADVANFAMMIADIHGGLNG